VPIDLILYTPGGLVLAAEQIAHALCCREARVMVIVPHYAMSGGMLIQDKHHLEAILPQWKNKSDCPIVENVD